MRNKREPPLGELVGELASDFKAWIMAEVALIKAQIESNTRKLLTAIILLVLAVVIVLAGIMVMAHTLVLILTPYFGVALAGFTVGGFLIALAVVFVITARSMIDLFGLLPERLRRALSSRKDS